MRVARCLTASSRGVQASRRKKQFHADASELLMRNSIFYAAAAACLAGMLPTGATAQPYGYRGYDRGHNSSEYRFWQRECERAMRSADSRRRYQKVARVCRQQLSKYRPDRRYDDREWRRDGDARWRYDRSGDRW